MILVPTNWPLMWDGGDDIRAACPACGAFHLYIERPSNKIECRACGLTGAAATQRAFDKLTKVKSTTTLKEATAS